MIIDLLIPCCFVGMWFIIACFSIFCRLDNGNTLDKTAKATVEISLWLLSPNITHELYKLIRLHLSLWERIYGSFSLWVSTFNCSSSLRVSVCNHSSLLHVTARNYSSSCCCSSWSHCKVDLLSSTSFTFPAVILFMQIHYISPLPKRLLTPSSISFINTFAFWF